MCNGDFVCATAAAGGGTLAADGDICTADSQCASNNCNAAGSCATAAGGGTNNNDSGSSNDDIPETCGNVDNSAIMAYEPSTESPLIGKMCMCGSQVCSGGMKCQASSNECTCVATKDHACIAMCEDNQCEKINMQFVYKLGCEELEVDGTMVWAKVECQDENININMYGAAGCNAASAMAGSKVTLIKKGIHAAEDEDPGFIRLSALCESSTATTKTAIDSNSTRTRESPTVRTQDSNSNSTEEEDDDFQFDTLSEGKRMQSSFVVVGIVLVMTTLML